jgi:hypothetical protein
MEKTVVDNTLEDRVAKLESIVNDISAKIRKMSDNWKKFCNSFVGSSAKDGKIGSARASLLVVIVLSAIGVAAFAEVAHVAGDKTHWGTAAIRADGSLVTEGGIYATNGTIAASGGIVTNLTLVGSTQLGQAGNAVAVGGNMTISGAVDYADSGIIIRSNTYVSVNGSVSVANGGSFGNADTPIYELRPSATGVVTLASVDATAVYAGQYMTFINCSGGSGTNLIFNDATNVAVAGSSVTLGQYDAISFRFTRCHDGTNKWIQVGSSDN